MTDTTTTAKTRTITLTGRPPVMIVEDNWPVIAESLWQSGGDWSDGNRGYVSGRRTTCNLFVRQHADGRTLVYGSHHVQTQWQGESDARVRRGVLLATATMDDIVSAITSLCDEIGFAPETADPTRWDGMAAAAIADLPAEDLT